MKINKKQGNKGFSLVELMVVVGIIGVLTAIAVPRYQIFQAKAKQSEAKINLSHIHTLQTSYHLDNSTYATSLTAATGLNVDMTKSGGLAAAKGKYYTLSLSGVGLQTFVGNAKAAKGVLASCSSADNWTVDQDKKFTPGTGLNGC